ncbi:hypothetical protein [Wolbachia endosymbiont of Cantharis cryptica]|uniref:hypothetical protein n=1 Tax=Wolbachia endosymbiont of Cantharis cryptica TaxID=3066132 RepID=UPI00376F20DB
MLAGENNNRQQNRNRAQALVERIQNAYNNTGKIKRFINIILLVSMIPPFFFLAQFLLYSWLVDYFFKPEENETRLSAWPKNIIRLILRAVLIVCIIISCVFLALPVLFLWLLNRALIKEIWQLNNLILEAPEEERQFLAHDLVDVLPFVVQTTHDPNAVSSINLSVDRLIEKYKGNLSKEVFYVQLNKENTTDIEKYIKQSNEFTESEKSHALKCLEFINKTTGDSFKDSYSKLTLKQVAVLCWKACNDRNTGTENQRIPLSNEDIKNRRDIFIKGLIDAATTYGPQGQSCTGGTYNKIVESLSGLHPSVVITLNKEEAREMVKDTIIKRFPEMAREVLSNFPAEEQETIRKSFSDPSEIVMFFNAACEALEEKCQKFSSSLDSGKKKR